MKFSIRSLFVCLITIAILAALVSCSKNGTTTPPGANPPRDTTPIVKYPASFTSNPVLNPDTLYANTPGGMSWTVSHTKGATLYVGTIAINTSQDYQSATVPALSTSTTGRIDLLGEDDRIVSLPVNFPVYDTTLSFMCKATNFKMVSAIETWPGGSMNLTLDQNKYRYTRVCEPAGRVGWATHPGSPTEYKGYYMNLNDGAQFYDGQNLWDNVSITSLQWVRKRTQLLGGILYTITLTFIVVP